jgi:hypothetical protein
MDEQENYDANLEELIEEEWNSWLDDDGTVASVRRLQLMDDLFSKIKDS